MKLRLIGGLAAAYLMLAPGAGSATGGIRPHAGELIGRIIVPKIHLNISVVEGTKNDTAVPDKLPVHYSSTNLPGEGQTIVISAHHFTHPLPGAAGGPFLHLDRMERGDVVYLTVRSRFGGGKYRYVVTSNRTVDCGHTPVGFWSCPPALGLMSNYKQTKVYLWTCIGDGYQRRVVTAFPAGVKQR